MSISSLLKRCLEGDENAWAELMDWVTPLILSICRKNGLSNQETGDVFGQVSYRLLINLPHLRSAAKFFRYVGTITWRETIAVYRKTKIDESSMQPIADIMYDSVPETPDSIYEHQEKTENLMKAINRLPEKNRDVIKALFFEAGEPNYEEIATRLNIPVSSIGPTRLRSLKKLYRILKQRRIEL